MNWDWEKLSDQRRRQQSNVPAPDLDEIGERLKQLKGVRMPGGGKLVIPLIGLLWLASGIYIVQPDEVGVEQRFGMYSEITEPGLHYHYPYPIERVQTPRVTEIRSAEIGFRSMTQRQTFQQGQYRAVPEESLMLTGDENIVDVQFIVQYQIKDPVDYLFRVSQQEDTLKAAAEAAMREIIGNNKIDTALTTGKEVIQAETTALLQDILDRYQAGIRIVAVQLQDVHPPVEVVDAFKDVASAREDKSRIINEAEAYSNDILPKARGAAAALVNEAEAYKQSVILAAKGDSSRFTAVLGEYRKAKDVTRERLYLETMERILSRPDVEKVVLTFDAAQRAVPYLPLEPLKKPVAPQAHSEGGKKQ